ncbi:biopolymer transporter ExbD [Winogradskyella sp.]|nr:biopolymer transporter ExbD [Winogradskyella sp.]MDC0006683.1 biopolymer transporter ExbD [Winogradskyella sp.]
MKSSRRYSVTINAGSMADIAFLLLIFFLVTTTISAEKGILRTLPSLCEPGQDCTADFLERNVLRISLNEKQEILIEDKLVKIKDIQNLVELFIDNNGEATCNYCVGLKATESSQHPTKAVISLSQNVKTTYDIFIAVQDEITKAYYNLRERYTKNVLQKEVFELTKQELMQVKKAYPFIVSEVVVKRAN